MQGVSRLFLLMPQLFSINVDDFMSTSNAIN